MIPQKTREFHISEAYRCLDLARYDNAVSPEGICLQYAQVHATLAAIAPPTENPTPPTQDGAALGLLTALVSESREAIVNMGKTYVHNHFPEFEEAVENAESYVREQAAKGDGK